MALAQRGFDFIVGDRVLAGRSRGDRLQKLQLLHDEDFGKKLGWK